MINLPDTLKKFEGSFASYEKILDEIGETFGTVVAVDGPTNVGKTLFALETVRWYERNGKHVVYLPLDYFLISRSERNEIFEKIIAGEISIDEYSMYGWDFNQYERVLNETLKHIRQNEREVVTVENTYNRVTGMPELHVNLMVLPDSVVVTEGVGLHTYKGEMFDTRIRIEVEDHALLLDRVLEREKQKDKKDYLDTEYLEERFHRIDLPHARYLYQQSVSDAHYVLNTTNFDTIEVYSNTYE